MGMASSHPKSPLEADGVAAPPRRTAWRVAGWMVAAPALAWVLAAWYFTAPLAVLVVLALLVGAAWRFRRRGALRAVWAIAVVAALGWLLRPARADRAWAADVAEIVSAEIAGDVVTIKNVRNFSWRSLTDFTPRWETRTYRLSQLRHLDFIMTYWGSPHICHTMLTFDFGEGGRLCASIETRREVGETYSALRGMFRQYELIYVLGDERDLLRLRTDIRPRNEVFLYRVNARPEQAQAIFREYLATANGLRTQPGWYHTLLTNCTTSIRQNVRHAGVIAPWDWRLLANGHIHEQLHALGYLHRALPLPELERASRIGPAAQAAGDAPDFSARIRAGRPGF
jgi:hypothetical protein